MFISGCERRTFCAKAAKKNCLGLVLVGLVGLGLGLVYELGSFVTERADSLVSYGARYRGWV